MLRNTDESLTRAFTRRAAQVVLVGAMAAAPLALSTGLASADTDWDELAQCESSGDWSTNTGNGFGGGLQFTDSTWKAFGGSGSPEDASRSEQIQVAERVKAEQGMNAWPTCSKKTGNTDSSANSGSSDSDSGPRTRLVRLGLLRGREHRRDPAGPADPAGHGPRRRRLHRGERRHPELASPPRTASRGSPIAQNNAIADPDAISPGQQLKLG